MASGVDGPERQYTGFDDLPVVDTTSQRRATVAPQRRAEERTSRRESRVVQVTGNRRSRIAVIFFAAVLAMCAAIGLLAATPAPKPILVVQPIVLVLAFAATEATALHVESRRDSHNISMAAFPLLIGLLAVSPTMLVATRLAGAGFSLAFVRGRRGTPLVWNTAVFAAATAVAALIASVVLVDGEVNGVGDWLMLLGALLGA